MLSPFVVVWRRSTAAWAAVVVVGCVWFAYQSTRTTDLALWADSSYSLRFSLVLTGPVCAALGAWIGREQHVWRSPGAFEISGRSAMSRLVLSLGAALAWCWLGLGVATVLVSWTPLRHATWGHLDPSQALLAASGMALWLLVGALAGTLLPHPLTSLLVGVFAYVVQMELSSFARSTKLSPVDETYWIAHPMPLPYLFGQLAWQAALVALTCLLLSLLLNRAYRRLVLTGLLAGIVLLPVTAYAAIRPATNSDEVIAASDLVCSDAGAPQVCVQAAFAPMLPQVAASVQTMLTPLVEARVAPTRVTQAFSREDPGNPTFLLGRLDNSVTRLLAERPPLLMSLFDGAGCHLSPVTDTEYATQSAVINWLMSVRPLTSPERRLVKFLQDDPAKTSVWLKGHWEALVNCRLPIDEALRTW